MNIPDGLKYTKDHEWIKIDGTTAIIGITDFAQGELGDIVIIHIGTNGPMSDADFDAIMAELQGVRAVLFVNVHVPREWQNAVNATLAAGAARYQNALLIDWQRESAPPPRLTSGYS